MTHPGPQAFHALHRCIVPCCPSRFRISGSSISSGTPHLVCYATPSELLRATLPSDTWHMNLDLGSVAQFLAYHAETKGLGSGPLLLAVWTEDDLDLTLVRLKSQVTLSCPRHSTSLSPLWLSTRTRLLGEKLHELIASGEQQLLTSIRGANPLVEALVAEYGALAGTFPRRPPGTEWFHAHLPRSRLSLPTLKLPDGQAIRPPNPAASSEIERLTELVRQFRGFIDGPDAALEGIRLLAVQAVKEGLRFQEFLVYTVKTDEEGEEWAGYVRVGRITRGFGAVRNVYTVPGWQGKGVGSALARAAVVRLMTEEDRMRDILRSVGDEGEGGKVRDVGIFTTPENRRAQRAYAKAGFGFPEAEWEEEGGKSWERYEEVEYEGAGV